MAGLSLGGVSSTVLADDVSTRALDTVRVGELAGKLSAGSRNVFTGVGAGANVQASDVVLVGFEAGKNARSLSLAVFVGTRAGSSADRSFETTLVGYAAGEAMRDCRQCVGIGAHVLREATAISTTAVGYRALERSLDADYNTAVGAECMQNNRSGSFNTALGFQTMRAAFTCSECVMVGAYAGYSNARAGGMTVVGYKACEFLEAGEYSVALGAFALQYSAYSSNTVAIGASAGRGATASDAVLIGSRVASGAADVSGGVIIGESAASFYAGRRSVLVGANAGSNVIGDDNVLLGAGAVSGGRASCSRTVAIGADIGARVRTSVASVFIGGADAFSGSVEHGIAIGTAAVTTSDRSISIGGDIDNERYASVLIGNELTSDADNSVVVGKDIGIASVIFFKDPLLDPFTNAVATDAFLKLGASNIEYTDILGTPDGQLSYSVAAVAGYLTESVSNTSRIPIDLLGADRGYDLLENAPNGTYAITHGLTTLSAPYPTYAAAWASSVNASFIKPATVPSSAPLTVADAYAESHGLVVSAPVSTTVNVVDASADVVPLPYFTPKRARAPKSDSAAVVLPVSIDLPQALAPQWSYPSDASAIAIDMPPAAPDTCNIVFEVASPPSWGRLSNVGTNALYYELPLEAVFAESDAFAVRPVQVMRETVTGSNYGSKYSESNAYAVIHEESARLFVPNAVPTSNVIALDQALFVYAPRAPSVNQTVRVQSIPNGATWQTSDGAFTAADVSTMVAENIDLFPNASNAIYYASASNASLAALSGLEGEALTTVAPALQALTGDVTSLSNKAGIYEDVQVLWGTAVAGLNGLGVSDSARVAWATAASSGGATLFANASNAVNQLVLRMDDVFFESDPLDLRAQIISIEDVVFSTYGIYPLSLNVRAFLQTVPTAAVSERAFLLSATGPGATGAINAATAYDLWRRKFFEIPRTFPAIGESRLVGSALVGGSFDVLLGLDEFTIDVGAAQPALHPNWELASNMTVTVPYGALSRPLQSLAVASARVLVSPQYGELFPASASPVNLSSFTYRVSHPFKSDDARLLVQNGDGAQQTIEVQLARPESDGLYVRDIHAPWEPRQETRAWLGYAYEVVSERTFALSNTFIQSGNSFHEIASAQDADDAYDEISLPTSNYEVVANYNAALGLVTIHSNVQSFRIIASATENQSLGDVNLISPQYTFTYCNVFIDFDAEPLREITGGATVPLTTYTLPLEDGAAPSNISVSSNVILTRTEQRLRAYDAYVDTYAGTSNLIRVNTRIHAESAPRFLYSYGERIAAPPTSASYVVALETGRTARATLERTAYGTSNVEVFASTAVVGTHHLAVSGGSGANVGVAGVAGAAPWILSNVGPVTSFAYESLASGKIVAPVPEVSAAAPVYNVTYGTSSSALAAYGYNYDGTFAVATVANESVVIDPVQYRAVLNDGEEPPQGATHVHYLRASGGFVADTRLPVSVPSIFIPDALNTAHDMLWFYADANKNIVGGGLQSNVVFVASAPHPGGQAVNRYLSYAPTSILSPRAFAISRDVTFGGFRQYVDGAVVDVQATGWGLRERTNPFNFVITGSVLSASAIDSLQLQTGEDAYAWLRYIESGVVKYFLVSSYAKDDYPLLSEASSSAWQNARLGNAPSATHSFLGQWWSDITRTYDSSAGGLANLVIELTQPLQHAFFVSADGNDDDRMLQRFPLADKATLRVVPRTPLGFKNEVMRFRVMYKGRPSPVYSMPFQPFWSIFPESGEEVYRSPSLVELGYAWELDEGTYTLKDAGGQILATDATRVIKTVPGSTSPSVVAGAPIARTLDQADRYELSAADLLGVVSYVPETSRELVFYMVSRPLSGVLMFVDGAPATRFVLSDVSAGRVIYQHLGGAAATDVLELRVASGPFDVSAGSITFAFTLRALPRVTTLTEANLYVMNAADLALARQFTSNQLAITGDDGYLHVLDANYIVTNAQTFQANSFEYSIDADILIGGAPYPALSFEFVANASPGEHVNVLASLSAYRHLFRRTMRATLNKHVATEAFLARPQPAARQGFDYEIDVNSEGARNFEGRSVGVYLEYATKQTLDYADANAEAQIARLRQLRYVLEGVDADDNTLFRLDVGKERVLFNNTSGTVVPLNLQPSFNVAAFNTLYFVNNEAGHAAFYLDYNFEDSKAVNAARNVFAGAELVAVDFARLKRISFTTDLQDSSNIVSGEFVETVGAGLQASYSLSNYANTFELRNFEVLINTNALETSGVTNNNDSYNVVLGSRIQVRGVNNICIGSTFTTSGQKSIILGNNIGVTSGTAQLNDIYESIIIGSDSFANSFVRDVISIGKNNFNDLIEVDSERVASLLARKPILIGNDITNMLVDFHVNIGNTFLKTSQGAEQIYLGLGGETVGIGFNSNVGLSGDKLVVAGSTRTERLTLAHNGHVAHVGDLAPGAQPVFGEVVRYSASQKIAVCTQANDTMVAGIWGNETLITSGRTRIYVTGTVTAGNLLTSGPDLAGTAIAQILSTTRMSYTVAKALESVQTAVGERVLIECVA